MIFGPYRQIALKSSIVNVLSSLFQTSECVSFMRLALRKLVLRSSYRSGYLVLEKEMALADDFLTLLALMLGVFDFILLFMRFY
jgi:hypothetical protein